jgi:hypothetical protein
MAVKRFSVSFEEELATRAQASAATVNEPFSVWLSEAVQRRLRQDALLAAVADFESEHSELSPSELVDSKKRLGIDRSNLKSRRKSA